MKRYELTRYTSPKSSGSALINVVVSLVLMSILMAGVVLLYSSISGNSKEASQTNLLGMNSGTALLKIMGDIQHAGSFGCFDARIVGSNVTTTVVESIPSVVSGVGRFESAYGGIKVFSASAIPTIDATALNLSADNLVAGSQILKLQYAKRFALISNIVANGHNISIINFESPVYFVNNGGVLSKTSASKFALNSGNGSSLPYILASCSRLDELLGTVVGNTLTINSPAIPLASHDTSSWRLMNMETRYYYLVSINGVKSLYSKDLQANGNMSESQMILRGVNTISYSFEIESGLIYQTKSFANMTAGDWNKARQLTYEMELQAVDTETPSSPLIESISQSVMLRGN